MEADVCVSAGSALASGERALRTLMAVWRRGGLHGGHERTHHDIHAQRRGAAG